MNAHIHFWDPGVQDPVPYLEHALAVFGPDDHVVVAGLVSDSERESVLAATAERVYRLSSEANQEERSDGS